MYVDSLTPDTVSAVVAVAGYVKVTFDHKVEADRRLVLCPTASDLDLDMLMGYQERDIRKFMVEHDARMVAMRSRRE